MRQRSLIGLFLCFWLGMIQWQVTQLCPHCLLPDATPRTEAETAQPPCHDHAATDSAATAEPDLDCPHACQGTLCQQCHPSPALSAQVSLLTQPQAPSALRFHWRNDGAGGRHPPTDLRPPRPA